MGHPQLQRGGMSHTGGDAVAGCPPLEGGRGEDFGICFVLRASYFISYLFGSGYASLRL